MTYYVKEREITTLRLPQQSSGKTRRSEGRSDPLEEYVKSS